MTRHLSQISLSLAFLLLLSGCGRGVGTIHVKSPATGEKTISAKSSVAFVRTTRVMPLGESETPTVAISVYIANYDLDPRFLPRNINMPESDDGLLVLFYLIGDKGATAISPGTYSTTGDLFMKVAAAGGEIVSRADGVQTRAKLERAGLTGSVIIHSVSGDTITADLDLTSGDVSVKGPFTSKIVLDTK